MRVIAGRHRGRKLLEFKGGDIRPTLDRAKESLFNILQNNTPASRVLDLFCGSGSLGIEALSRGAAEAVFVDNSKDSLKICRQNLFALKEDAKVVQADAESFLAGESSAYDIIFLDPPYAFKDKAKKCLELIGKKGLLAEGGVAVIESDLFFEGTDELEVSGTRKYGAAYFTFFNRRAKT